METHSIAPNKKITIPVPKGFFIPQSMVSIKGVGLNQVSPGNVFSFKVTYKDLKGHTASFHLQLEAPYFFAGGTFNYQMFNNVHMGPYTIVEIESPPTNPTLVIQVGFTDKLA
jgi:hypothetical protein